MPNKNAKINNARYVGIVLFTFSYAALGHNTDKLHRKMYLWEGSKHIRRIHNCPLSARHTWNTMKNAARRKEGGRETQSMYLSNPVIISPSTRVTRRKDIVQTLISFSPSGHGT